MECPLISGLEIDFGMGIWRLQKATSFHKCYIVANQMSDGFPLCCYLLLLIPSVHEVIRMVSDDSHDILFSCHTFREHFPINLVFAMYIFKQEKKCGPIY